MRVLLWHGWLLEGSGSNVFTARVAEVLRADGHDVLVVCQEPHPEAFPFVDAWGTVGPDGVSELHDRAPTPSGRVTLLRPEIGSLLPVFVYDDYEGFSVKRFVDLTDDELEAYLGRNADALREAARWHRSELVVAKHGFPGPVIARRALGEGYVALMHGSELEFAVTRQDRYLDLAREGLEGAAAVYGSSADVLRRAVEAVPSIAGRIRPSHPGVDVEGFRPRDRDAALEEGATLLDGEPRVARGRPASTDAEVERAVGARDAGTLAELGGRYDPTAPDPDAAAVLRGLRGTEAPIVGYLGKLIPTKGVHVLLRALAELGPEVCGLIVGFGGSREWLHALVVALERGDEDAVAWIGAQAELEVSPPTRPASGLRERVAFTGRLDHRYAPPAVSAMDVLVVPSVASEAFGIVAIEGAASGALPLLARHSGLAEVAGVLESAVGAPGLFSYAPGEGADGRIVAGIRRLLAHPADERQRLGTELASLAARDFTWRRTASRLLEPA